jgi:hypothetical protein
MRLGVILGDLVTHERVIYFWGAGAMRRAASCVPWHLKELEVISRGLMMFMPQETERMRTNVRARAARERAMEGALTPPTK